MFNEMSQGQGNGRLQKVGVVVLAILGLYLLTLTVSGFMNLRYVGAGVMPANTINVSGEGEVFAVPDIATFSFTVTENAETTALAQEKATKKINAAINYLKDQKIAEKDIKTTSYSIYPKYEAVQVQCFAYPCPPQNPKIVGYETSQTITVKVRDTKVAGDLLVGIGKLNITIVSGIDFTIDNDDAIKSQAREKAIAEAKSRAEALAKQLGVKLVRIVSFSENSGPIYYAYDKTMSVAEGRGGATPETSPELPVGENKYTSNVYITYEIR